MVDYIQLEANTSHILLESGAGAILLETQTPIPATPINVNTETLYGFKTGFFPNRR